MAITDQLARWEKKDLYLGLETSISTHTTQQIKARDLNFGSWPLTGKSIEEWDLTADGDTQLQPEAVTLGRANPNFGIEQRATKGMLSLGLASLLQNKTFSVSKYTFGKYTDPQAKWFLFAQAGYLGSAGAGAIYQAWGSVVRTLTLTIPPVGPDRGKVGLRFELIGADGTRTNALTGTGATLDATAQLFSDDFTIELAGASAACISGEVSLTNGAERSLNLGATPDQINFGRLGITGNVAVALSSANADPFDNLVSAYEGKTAIQLKFKNTADCFINFNAIISEPTFSDAANIAVATFGYRGIVGSAGTAFSAGVDGMTDTLVTWV